MKKDEFVSALAKKAGVTKKVVEDVLGGITEIVVSEVRDGGDTVAIPGLGTFKQKVNSAREGINPLNKEPMSIKESHTVAFRAVPSVKKVIEPKAKKKK